MIVSVVLAAGAGERFGGSKQLAKLHGRPLLEYALRASAASSVERSIVVLGARSEAILAEVDLHGAEPIVCEDWRQGQANSLRAGVRAAAGAEAIVVTLGDQPGIRAEAIERVIEARDPEAVAVRATYNGLPGHPVLVEQALFEAVERLSGDAGAREILAGERVREVPCDGLGSADDVDTPEALRALEQRGSEG